LSAETLNQFFKINFIRYLRNQVNTSNLWNFSLNYYLLKVALYELKTF